MVDILVAGSLSERRRYRRWRGEAKRAICLETRCCAVSVGQLHSLNAKLIFEGLRDARFAPGGMLDAAPVFQPVQLRDGEVPMVPSIVPAEGDSLGRVEIVLADGHRLTAVTAR